MNYQVNEKIHYEKNREKPLHKKKNRYISFAELRRSHVELQNKSKALDENLKDGSQELTLKTIKIFIAKNCSKSL